MASGREVAGGGVEVEEGVGGVGRRREEKAAADELRVQGARGREMQPR